MKGNKKRESKKEKMAKDLKLLVQAFHRLKLGCNGAREKCILELGKPKLMKTVKNIMDI